MQQQCEVCMGLCTLSDALEIAPTYHTIVYKYKIR